MNNRETKKLPFTQEQIKLRRMLLMNFKDREYLVVLQYRPECPHKSSCYEYKR